MTEVSAHIRLRPTRIGFLVKPNDLVSVRSAMRLCTTLWGGIYNPLIPVFSQPPREWKSERHETVKGVEIAKGYVRFFEPDVFVEAKPGLAKSAGLDGLRSDTILYKEIVSLKKLLSIEDDGREAELAFGQSVIDVLSQIYEEEQRFTLKKNTKNFLVKPQSASGLSELLFGVYPTSKDAAYFKQAFKDVFEAEEQSPTPETWIDVYVRQAIDPLAVTTYQLDVERLWIHDPKIIIFDPTCATDLIDAWNSRLLPNRILPVPIEWVEELAPHLQRYIKRATRPVRGNPHGLMHSCGLEFGRSIPTDECDRLAEIIYGVTKKGTRTYSHGPWPIWQPQNTGFMHRIDRMKVTAAEERLSLEVREGKKHLSASFRALSPDFARRFGGINARWVNAVIISHHSERPIATVFPFNTFDRSWPRLGLGGESVGVGSEGWTYPQTHMNMDEAINLLSSEESLIGTFKLYGIEATLSDPGSIARQILEHVGGLRMMSLIANKDLMQLLNKMAGSLRTRGDESITTEEHFGRRSASIQDWEKVVKNLKVAFRKPSLIDYTDRNIIRLGLETKCPNCQGYNWHGLDAVDYNVLCERCLNEYSFPQVTGGERVWKYRVIGPFSVPDFAAGSYSSLLTLRAITSNLVTHGATTFSTSLNLKFDELSREIDFAALRTEESSLNPQREPILVIGECKSFGKGELIRLKDLNKLKDIMKKLPNCAVVISVMRDHFTSNELKILKKFVDWADRLSGPFKPKYPIILLTGTELFARYHIGDAWKSKGGKYEDFADYSHTQDLYALSDSTRAIYLDSRRKSVRAKPKNTPKNKGK